MSHDPAIPVLRRPPAPTAYAAHAAVVPLRTESRGSAAPAAVQGALALDLRAAHGMPETPELQVVPTARDDRDVDGWSGRLVQAVVEVLGGDRPLSQLLRWTSQAVYHDLDRRVKVLRNRSAPTARPRAVRPQVRSVHVFQPTPDSAEVSAHVRYGQRSRAIAARLEWRRGHWLCTAMQFG